LETKTLEKKQSEVSTKLKTLKLIETKTLNHHKQTKMGTKTLERETKLGIEKI
jgi:hypothetical protein